MVEGHVPRGVWVQLPPSALPNINKLKIWSGFMPLQERYFFKFHLKIDFFVNDNKPFYNETRG